MLSNWSTAVLSGVSSDTEPTVIVTFDDAKYIFNAGENICRTFTQSKRRWTRTKAVFLTSAESKRTSGLAGLLMTFADSSVASDMKVVGPPGITHTIAAMRTYTRRDTMDVTPIEVPMDASPEPVFKDANISVYSLPITPSQAVDAIPVDYPDSPNKKRKRSTSPETSTKRHLTSPDADSSSEMPFSQFVAQKDFSATSLTGDPADLWRKLVVKTMFPARNVKPPKEKMMRDAEGKKQAKKPEPIVIPIVPVNSRRRPHADFYNPLPKFSAVSCDPTMRPCTAYAIVGPRMRGKFNAQAAGELGVPHGLERSKLTKGESITFLVKVGNEMVERTVRPEQCMEASRPPAVLLLFDIPSTNHIAALISAFHESALFPRLRSSRAEDKEEYDVRTVFHICGPGVLEDPRYIDFMSGFDAQTHHLIASREHCPDPVTFTSAAFSQFRLNHLDPEMFTIPKFNSTPRKDIQSIPNIPAKSSIMASNIIVGMRPAVPPMLEPPGIHERPSDRFHPAMEQQPAAPLPQTTVDAFDKAKLDVTETMVVSPAVPGADVRVLPLGTGSATPTKYRNVSSTLIQIPGRGSILLDAGEGTWGQLTRQFGLDPSQPNNVWDVLRDIKCIFLSHSHGDHHMGVVKLLVQRQSLDPPPKDPLYIISIRNIHMYIRESADLEDLGLDDDGSSSNGVRTIMSEAVHYRQYPQYQTEGRWALGGKEPWTAMDLSRKNAQDMCDTLGLEGMYTIDVEHFTRCYGVTIRHKDGWSIVFSADTRPTSNLVRAGKDATLLIHEASMGDEEAELAAKKGHTTFGEAIAIGRRMNAKHILLTHFSGRYPKMPPSGVKVDEDEVLGSDDDDDYEKQREHRMRQLDRERNAGKPQPIVALAFDHANMSIGTMWKMNKYMDAIAQSFADTAEEGDAEEEEMAKAVMDLHVDHH